MATNGTDGASTLHDNMEAPYTAEDAAAEKAGYTDTANVPRVTLWTFFMAVLVSMGGIIFGFDTGQIRYYPRDQFTQGYLI
jgi:hypothetical protein